MTHARPQRAHREVTSSVSPRGPPHRLPREQRTVAGAANDARVPSKSLGKAADQLDGEGVTCLADMTRRQAIDLLREAARKEAAGLIRLVPLPAQPDDNVQRRIERAASRLGWGWRRTRAIWHGEARIIESFEMDQLRQREPGKRR
jgi:hypothetical protein